MVDHNTEYDIDGSVGNVAENVSIGQGNFNQLNQQIQQEHEPFPVSDPTGLNLRIGLISTLLDILPLDLETLDRIVGAVLVIGLLGIAGLMYAAQSGARVITETLPRHRIGLFGLLFLMLATFLAAGYFGTKRESTCSNCGTPFGYRHVESEVVDRVTRPDQPDIKRVKQRLECRKCGHEVNRPWSND